MLHLVGKHHIVPPLIPVQHPGAVVQDVLHGASGPEVLVIYIAELTERVGYFPPPGQAVWRFKAVCGSCHVK